VSPAAGGLLLVAGLGGLGCAHGEPFRPEAADSLGPAALALPRRLTFNVGDDRSPAWNGTDLTFSRYDPAHETGARCLAALPPEGGTLRVTWCPPPPTPRDTFIGTWLEPAVADDGRSVAYVWQRGTGVSIAAWSRHLVVAAVDSPAAPRHEVPLAGALAGGGRYNAGYELSWAGPDRVRLVAAVELVVRVTGEGTSRLTDTALLGLGLIEWDLATGVVRDVPGGDGVTAYTRASGGGWWIARAGTVWHLDDGGVAVPRLMIGDTVSDLAEVDGRVLIARVQPIPGQGYRLELWDPATEVTGAVVTPGPVHRLAAVGGRRFVAEVEADAREFGAPANLWLFELPARSAR
jgi:hypothetical protein